MKKLSILLAALSFIGSAILSPRTTAQEFASQDAPSTEAALQKDRLVAWCIVPFDSKKRTPVERAEMLDRIGIKRLAYDYRAEHIATFDEEMEQLKKHNIELTAWWFPGELNDEARLILDVLKRHQLKTQLWVTGGGGPTANEAEQNARVQAESARLRPIAIAASEIGCKLGLYNHGGWFGEPENQIAIIEAMKLPNVGIVYNLHHGHPHMDRFEVLLSKMKPYLYTLNLNGMVPNGEAIGKKIVPIGAGDQDLEWLKIIRESGYRGPIGILNHTDHDAETRLLDNLDGLEWIQKRLSDPEQKTPPKYRTWNEPVTPPKIPLSMTEAEKDAIRSLVQSSQKQGQADRGVAAFAAAGSACLQCHKIGAHGGTVGPDLTQIGMLRTPEQIADSLLFPNHSVEEKFRVVQLVTSDGELAKGYLVSESEQQIVLKDPSKGKEVAIDKANIEERNWGLSLMPEGLVQGMPPSRQADLLAFLTDLGHHKKIRIEIAESVLEHAQSHDPAPFPYDRKPLNESAWPSWEAFVNRDRVYDFYSKEARYFRAQENGPVLLAEFPGMDDGKYGHWGNQKEETWASDAWNSTLLGSVQSGVFHSEGVMVPRGVCLQLGEKGELGVCFNPETASYSAAWQGGFLKFSSVRHGFMHGVTPSGKATSLSDVQGPQGKIDYQGFYRIGKRTVFAYRVDGVEYLDAPWWESGKWVREVGPRAKHSMRDKINQGKAQWAETITTEIRLGHNSPYALDTIELPTKNPWNALIFCGDHDFLPDGSALVCTMQGDVWHVSGIAWNPSESKPVPSPKATWRRFASGLHQPLGLKVEKDGIFVLCRDQLTRLHDLNNDGEADFYECYSNAFETSPAGHDFICGLQRDSDGNFYTASGNQGIVRIAKDGKKAEVIAEGFRNPDGLGLYPDGVVTVPCSEGEWTPTSLLCAVQPRKDATIPFYGYRGAKFVNRPIEQPQYPMLYLPRGVDNSAGGQVYVDSDRWGPLKGQMIHLSYGTGAPFLILRDEVDGVLQGAAVPLEGEFLSGAHRGRFSPRDGQLYVSGMGGWGTYTPQTGCFHRMRYTGQDPVLPIGLHMHENGIAIRFSQPIDAATAANPRQHFVQAWNYRYSAAYGSQEYSTRHYGVRGHDRWEIQSAHLLDNGRTLFLELPDLQPANQVHLQIMAREGQPIDLFATCNRLDKPLTNIPNYQAMQKKLQKHPIEMDMAMVVKRAPNPWRDKLEGARTVRIEAGKNLTYQTTSIQAKAGEKLAMTLANPDVVPHNWALIKPGKLQVIGEAANRLVGDPEALIRQYVPQSDDVLCYTDIIDPGQEGTIYFQIPNEPGRYPYLCTFPGHWMVMNGEIVVSP